MAFAIPWTFALPELWPAVAALLLLWAAGVLLAKPLTWALQQVPVIGGTAAGIVGSALGAVTRWSTSWAEGMVHPLTQLISAAVTGPFVVLRALVSGVEQLAGYVSAVAREAGDAVARIESTVPALVSEVDRLAAQVLALPGALASLESWARTAITAALAEAVRRAEAGAAVAMTATVGQAVRGLESLVAAARAEAAGLVSAEERARTASIAALAATLGADVTALERNAGIEARAIESAAATDVAGVRAQLGELAKGIEAAGLLALPLEVARIAENVETLTTECIAPTCNAVKPQLPMLQGLADAAAIAAFVALVAQAVREPEATAREVAGVVGEAESIVGGLVADVFGVRV